MRGGGGGEGYYSVKMGVPNNSNAGRAGEGDRRPSKLMMMRDDYHKKILKEKEQKMVQLYEDNQVSQKKAMMRIMRGGSGEGSGGVATGNQTMGNGGGASVRDFFNERRRLEASGAPVPPIDDHFRQAKGYSSPGGWSSRTGSGNSAKKFSAGRDRSQPLAPIRRPSDTKEISGTGNTPKGEKNGNGHGMMHAEPNPFNARPKLVKHKPLPPTNGYASQYQNQQNYQNQHNNPQQNNHIDRNNNDKQHTSPPSKFGYQGIHQQRTVQHRQQPQPQLKNPHNFQRQQQQQQFEEPMPPQPPQQPNPKQPPQSRVNNGKFRAAGVQPKTPKSNPPSQQRQQQQPKMTDFQKWQLEQNKAREERLKKFNNNNKNDKNQGSWGDPEDDDDEEDDNNPVYNNHGKNRYEYEDEEEEEEEDDVEEKDDDDDDGQEDEVRRMERELLEKIEREKVELERIRREKMVAEEEEKREMEENKKREKAERIKQKKLEEQRRKEEEQRRREEEEDERRERQREERERKEEDKRRREEDKRRKEEERVAAKREKEEQKRLAKIQKQQAKDSARSSQGPSYYDQYDDTPEEYSRRSPALPTSARLTMGEIDERPAVSNATDASYYAKIAKSNEAKGSVGSLAKCKVCGRSFAVDRLKKHQTACTKANKPRKEFDSSKKRVEGTEAAKYVGRSKREPAKKKNNWRAQHEEFINSLRYAKKAAQYEKEGKDLRELTPPPSKENPDLVPCPYCNRTFNETAAERHIPRCKDLKTKPPPMKNRRR